MSLWSRDSLRVLLGATRAVFSRVGSSASTWHCAVTAPASEESVWQGALDAFSMGIASPEAAGARTVEVYFESDLLRFRVVPWQADFATLASRREYVAHCFFEIYGEPARTWRIEEANGRYGHASLAAATEAAFLEALAGACAGRGMRLGAAQPALAAAFSANLAEFGADPFWFVLFEMQRMTMLLVSDGAPVTVRSAARVDAQLSELLEREWHLLGMPDEPGAVYCCEFTSAGRTVPTLASWHTRQVGPGKLLREFLAHSRVVAVAAT